MNDSISRLCRAAAAAAVVLSASALWPAWAGAQTEAEKYTGRLKTENLELGTDIRLKDEVAFSSAPVAFITGHMSAQVLSRGTTFFVFTPSSAIRILRMQYSQSEIGQASGPAYVRCNLLAGTPGIQVDFDLNDTSFGFFTEATRNFDVDAQERVFCHANFDNQFGAIGTFNIILEHKMR